MADDNPTRALAEFMAQAELDLVPDRTRERTRVILLDALASAVAGRSADETPKVLTAARAAYGSGSATLLDGGSGALATAAMVNAYLITAVTVCDIHVPTVNHVTPEVVPPLLAVAEARHASGADVLLALALGLETTTRVGVGLDYAAFRRRGFHSPGVVGPFGGATAVGRILGLDVDALTHAYGIAASQAAGTWAQLGTPTIKFQQSHGALSGLLAGLLAEQGFHSTADALGAADGGLFATYADGGDPATMLGDLGVRWELERISLRPSPAAAYLQGVVTAVLALIAEHDVDPADVERMVVHLSGTGYDLHGRMDPKSRFQARLSARYVAAVVLHDRRCWMDQFTPERFADDALTTFARDRVEAVEDPAVIDAGALLEVVLRDRTTIVQVAPVPRGHPDDPLSFEDVAEKLRVSSEASVPAVAVEDVIEAIADLESVDDIARVLGAFRT